MEAFSKEHREGPTCCSTQPLPLTNETPFADEETREAMEELLAGSQVYAQLPFPDSLGHLPGEWATHSRLGPSTSADNQNSPCPQTRTHSEREFLD